MYRGDSAYGSGSSHRETTYTSRELNYGSYNRDAIPSAYSKEIGKIIFFSSYQSKE